MFGVRALGRWVSGLTLFGAACGTAAGSVEQLAPASAPPPVAAVEPTQAPIEGPLPVEPDLRAGPDLFKIVMGVDAPNDVASKLGATEGPMPCPPELQMDGRLNPAERKTEKRRKVVCWRASGLKDAPQARASFYDYGVGLVVYDLWLVYPLSSLSWLSDAMRAALGASDTIDPKAPQQSWSWTHTEVALGRQNCADMMVPSTCTVAALGITHWPTLNLATAGVTGRSSSVADRAKSAAPWDIRLGYDSRSVAEAKLRTAGFSVNVMGCTQPYPGVTRCYMDGGSLRGLRENTEVELVNPGRGTLVSELKYTFDLGAYADVVKQLTESYGKPVVEDDYGKSKWWTAEVGIEVWRRADSFEVTYFHGRLHQLAYKAMQLGSVEQKNVEKSGL